MRRVLQSAPRGTWDRRRRGRVAAAGGAGGRTMLCELNRARFDPAGLNRDGPNASELNHRWLDQRRGDGHATWLVCGREVLVRLGTEAFLAPGIAEVILDALVDVRASTRGGRIDGHSADRIRYFGFRQECIPLSTRVKFSIG